MGGCGNHVVLLPVVEVPGLTVAADCRFLRTGSNALVIVAGTTTHDEDLLRAIQLVDGNTNQHVGHGVGDGVLVDAGIGKEGAAGEITADVGIAVRLAAHELVVGCREGLERVHYNAAQDPAQIGGLFKSIILTISVVSLIL